MQNNAVNEVKVPERSRMVTTKALIQFSTSIVFVLASMAFTVTDQYHSSHHLKCNVVQLFSIWAI